MPDATSGQEPASADEFDRELRQLMEGGAGEPLFLEPSAAERLSSGAGPVRRTRRGLGQLTGSLVLAVFLALAGGIAWLRFAPGTAKSADVTGQTADAQPVNAGPAQQAALPEPSGTVFPVDLFAGPPADPFYGTLADHWTDGAAAIAAPRARPAGRFTAAQVAAAYGTARALLIAANLDRQTLLGGAPTAFEKLLTAAQRTQFLAGLNSKGVTKAGYPRSTRAWVASFAPGSTALVGSVIKVYGLMSVRAVTQSGTAVLAVQVNYLFAYAIEPPHDPADWTLVVDHVTGSIDFARWNDRDPGRSGALEPWYRAVITAGGAVACGPGDGYIHPDYLNGRSAAFGQSAATAGMYSLATPAAGGGPACERATGTTGS